MKGQLSPFVSQHRWLLLVLLVAFGLRFGWLLYARPHVVSDFDEYLESARTLREHGRFGYPKPNAFRLPAYPILLVALMVMTERVAWLALWSVILSTAICWLIYLLALRLQMPRRLAIGAALIYALLPNAIFYSPILASEHLLGVLVLGAMLVATSGWSKPCARFFVAGLLVGAATLTRGDGLVYGLVILVFGVTLLRRHDRLPQPTRAWRVPIARVAAVFALGVLVVVAPWAIRNEIVVGRGTMLGGRSGIAFFYAHNPRPGFRMYWDARLSGLGEAAQQRVAWRVSFEYIWNHPTSLIAQTWRSMGDVFAPNKQTYGIYWSTRQNLEGYPVRPSMARATRIGRGLSIGGAWFLSIIPLLALLNARAIGVALLRLVGSVVVMNWIFYCVLFLGVSRYRYLPDLFLCLPTAAVIGLIWRARDQGSPTITSAHPESIDMAAEH